MEGSACLDPGWAGCLCDIGNVLAPASARTRCAHAIHGPRHTGLHTCLSLKMLPLSPPLRGCSRHVTYEQCTCLKMVKGQGRGDRPGGCRASVSETCTPSPTWRATAHSWSLLAGPCRWRGLRQGATAREQASDQLCTCCIILSAVPDG